MRFIEGLLENAGIAAEDMREYLLLMGSKNVPALRALCESRGISEKSAEAICTVTSSYRPIAGALEVLGGIAEGEKMCGAYGELCRIYEIMKHYGLSERLYLDFSVINDMRYYDGVIFKGFVNGIPDSILSGGRYDRLAEKFGKPTEAIGFAVYLDKLERFGGEDSEYDVDVLLVYGKDTSPERVVDRVEALTAEGKSVRTSCTEDCRIRYRSIIKLDVEE